MYDGTVKSKKVKINYTPISSFALPKSSILPRKNQNGDNMFEYY